MPERGWRTERIFISYRREDSAAEAGRLCDRLNAVFGQRRVFMDIEDIAPGANFAEAIDGTIARCDTVLVVIGPRWREILDQRAAGGQSDYVAHEIAAALRRKVRLIPVLVGGADAQQLEGLPEQIAGLSFRQAAALRDSAFREDCARLEAALGGVRPWRKPALAAGGAAAAAVAVLAVSVWMFRGPSAQVRQLMNTAGTQIGLGEHERAFRTYQQVLRLDPGYAPALEAQLDSAMRWTEHFHVIVDEGQSASAIAGPPLAELLSVLEAGLARTTSGPRAADVLAHIGWAHWLNRHIAAQEFGPAAEQAFRKALAMDASNVYANAMFGNWLLQTGGSVREALQHFHTAVKTGKERPLVREMQLGGMTYNDREGVPPELVRVANQMRLGGEPIDDRAKRRILPLYSPTLHNFEELGPVLAAVPPGQAWATYQWLGGNEAFIHAAILETAGDSPRALAIYRTLRGERHGRIAGRVDAALKRLSK